MVEQVERIEQYTSGEIPPPVALRLRFASGTRPEGVLNRTRQVMRQVAVAQRGDWPTDDDWRRRLPAWFLRSFEGHNWDELIADSSLWDFGSWLDAMKGPGWEWWSSEVCNDEGIVRCVAYADPYGVEPLEFLLRSAGALEVDFKEDDG
jgi:hypothetical protein